MAPRPTGTATISFGLVSIPVNLFSASESKAAISFNMLHDEDHARVKQQLVCSKDGATVERDHIVKGYEFEKGQYVVFTPEELKALEEQSNQIMEITEFVPAREDRPRLLRQGLLPVARQGRRQGLPPPREGDDGDRPLRPREVRGARQAVPRRRASRDRPRGRAHDAAAQLRRRGPLLHRRGSPRGRGEGRRAEARDHAHGPDRDATSSIPRTTRTRSRSASRR